MRISLNGTEIYFDVEGSGLAVTAKGLVEKPTLIALHGGLGLDHGYLRPGLEALRDYAQIVYVDLRGQGRSGRPSLATCTLEQMADDVAALCRHLDIERAFVLGHSAGGFVALHTALRHPGLVAGLVLCASSPTVQPIIEEGGEPAPSLASRAGPSALAAAGRLFGGEISADSVADFFREVGPFYAAPEHEAPTSRLLQLSQITIEMMQHFMTVVAPSYDLRPVLRDIVAPTLVMVGKYDWVCPPRASRAIAGGIAGATLVEFADSGHFVFSEQPDRFIELVAGFLMKNAGQASEVVDAAAFVV
jgi:proline iminopeptidase